MRLIRLMIAALLVLPMLGADKPAPDAQGIVLIADVKDFTGWTYGAGKEASAGYQIQDGVLFCTDKDAGNLYTENEYADFHLQFEFKLEPNSNNGVGIRAPMQGDAAYVA